MGWCGVMGNQSVRIRFEAILTASISLRVIARFACCKADFISLRVSSEIANVLASEEKSVLILSSIIIILKEKGAKVYLRLR